MGFLSYLPEDKDGFNSIINNVVDEFLDGKEIELPSEAENFRKKYAGIYKDEFEKKFLERRLGYLKVKVGNRMIYFEDGPYAEEFLQKMDELNNNKINKIGGLYGKK